MTMKQDTNNNYICNISADANKQIINKIIFV